MNDATPTIALIDDEPSILSALKRLLRPTGWRVLSFTSPTEALEELHYEQPQLIVSDYRMPGMDGVSLLEECRRLHPDSVRMILSGQAELEAVLAAINQSQVYRFILKPWSDQDLLITLRNALDHQRLLKENHELAEIVREQNRKLEAQEKALSRLESDSPGITRVERDEEGFIDLSGWSEND
ncbi:MAG: response regulator [Oleiphilaceae bacterium]|nr:response regulator [Oleiphilaceae bacterium]